jgi:hypothetical protein
VAVPLILLSALLALDRWLYRRWYQPTYSELHALLADLDDINKDFLRFKPDWLLGSRYHADATLRVEAINVYTGQRLPYRIQTNNLGYRGPDVERAKAPGTLRVVALGGSSTMGPGVPVQRTFVHRLAGLLRPHLRPGRGQQRVEAINAGVDGYTSRQGLFSYFRDIRTLEPDLLLVAFDVNNVFQPTSALQASSWRPPKKLEDRGPDEPWVAFREHVRYRDRLDCLQSVVYESGLFYTLAYAKRWIAWQLAGATPLEAPPEPPRGIVRCKQPHRFVAIAHPRDPRVTRYRHDLAELGKLAHLDGVPLIFVSVPVNNVDLQDMNEPFPFSRVMAELARGRPDRRHVQPLSAFCRHPIGEVMIDEVHLSDRGHELVARALLEPALELLKTGR